MKLNNSKLVQILKTFSEEELSGFIKFAASPYFNNGRNYLPALKVIAKFRPGYGSPGFTKENIYKKIYPGKNFNEQVIKNIISGLTGLAERFIKISGFEKDTFNSGMQLLKELDARNLVNIFDKNFKQVDDYVNKENYKIQDYLYFKYSLEILKLSHLVKNNRNDKFFESNLNASEYIICYFLSLLSLHAGNFKADSVNYNKQTDFNLLVDFANLLKISGLIENAKKAGHKLYPFLEIYYRTLMIEIHRDDMESYQKLKDAIELYRDLLNKHDLAMLYLYIVRFCAHQINKGNDKFRRDHLGAFQKMARDNSFIQSDERYIQNNLFRDIIIAAIGMKKLDWAKEFLNSFIDSVHPDHKMVLYCHSLAMIEFEDKHFEKALEYSAKVVTDLPILKIDIKALLLKIFYETNEFNTAFDSIEAFSRFIEHNKNISSVVYEPLNNMIKFIKLFIRHKEGKQLLNPERIHKEIENTPLLTSKRWLLEKLNELE